MKREVRLGIEDLTLVNKHYWQNGFGGLHMKKMPFGVLLS